MDAMLFDNGTTFSLRPLSSSARDWIDANVQAEAWQWLGDSLVIDWRSADAIRDAMEDDGLFINRAP